MERIRGTVESLIHNAGLYLEPLFAALEDDGIQAFLELELDVDLPDGSFTGAALATDIDRCKTAVTALFTIVDELKTALSEDDLPTIAQKAAEALEQIGIIAESIKQLRDRAQVISETFSDPLASQLKDYCDQLFERVAMLLAIIYADSYLISVELLQLIGLVDLEPVTFGAPAFPKTVLHEKIFFSRLPKIIGSPIEHLKSVYRWGEDDFRAELLLERLSKWLIKNSFDVTFKPATTTEPSAIESEFFVIQHHKVGAVNGLSFEHKFPIPDNFTVALKVSELTTLELKVTGGFKDDFKWLFSAPGDFLVLSSNEVNASVALNAFALPVPPGDKLTLLSLTNVGHVDAAKVNSGVELTYQSGATLSDSTLNLVVQTSIDGGKLEVSFAEDGFLSKITQAQSYSVSFDLTLLYSIKDGLQIKGSGGPEIQLPVNIEAGPIRLSNVTIAIRPDSETIPIDVSADIRGTFGPITMVVERVGLRSTISFPEVDGNLGPLDLDIGFRPPAGVGLSVDGGGFNGGGFLKFEPEEARYSGMLELEFQGRFTLKAIGLLNTRLPNGQSGFSLLIVISSEFTPIQLGLGFKLIGVGGLLGLNRTVNLEPLRAGLRANTLSSILFPTDIIANADRIISDLKQVFPPQADRFIFGPMAKIGWGTPTLITVDLGLVIEIPDPVRLFILGVLRAVLPDESAAILRVQVNFLGEINFERRQLKFDASLFDSKLLAFTLTGDMAIRLDWGADANFLLTVGGFHPAYEPPPMDLPAIRRLTLSLVEGDNPRLKLEMYFAVTSNTAQFGAKLELYASAWKFNVYGFLSFDVLFQFSPFYFIAEITAMLALRIGSSSFASIKLSLTLEGPTPWKAQGTARFKICWFFTLKVRFNKTFGEARNTTLPDLAVLPLLAEALRADDNWEGELPSQRHRLESIREAPEITSQLLLLHPVGTLKISQKVVPLNVRIDRIGSQRPTDAREFRITQVQPEATPVTPQEAFAPAQFFDLTDEEKLTSASFKDFDSGLRIGDAERLQTGYAAARQVDYELKYIDSQGDQRLRGPKTRFDVNAGAFNTWTLQGAIAHSELSFARTRKSSLAPEAVLVSQESFAIVNSGDLKLFDELSLLGSERAAAARLNELIETNPTLRDTLQVVPAFERAA
jgi:hypothetical protein